MSVKNALQPTDLTYLSDLQPSVWLLVLILVVSLCSIYLIRCT